MSRDASKITWTDCRDLLCRLSNFFESQPDGNSSRLLWHSWSAENHASAPDSQSVQEAGKKHHPDASTDDPSALKNFKEVQDAGAVLGDETKRGNFDKYGSPDGPQFESAGPQRGGGGRRQYPSDGLNVPFNLQELLGGFRSGGRRKLFRRASFSW